MWEAARSYVGHTPLTCTNMVGDTGIEPVTSSVSGTGNASAEVRPRASVQVSRRWALMRTSPDGGEHDAVGVRVGVRVVQGALRLVGAAQVHCGVRSRRGRAGGVQL